MSNLSLYGTVCSTLSPHGSGRHYYLLCIQNLKGSSWISAPLGPGPPNNNLSPTHKKSTWKKSKNKTSAYALTLRQIDIEGFSGVVSRQSVIRHVNVLIVPFGDWERLRVVLRTTNEELAGLNAGGRSGGGE